MMFGALMGLDFAILAATNPFAASALGLGLSLGGLHSGYKDITAPKILEEIYSRNLKDYGDKLGTTMEYFKLVKNYDDAQIIASSGKPGGSDIIAWVVENTGWDITNWARYK